MTKQNIAIFGEVLYDHFTDGSCVLGGAPFNVAWHLQAFGRSPLFISRVGQDRLGVGIRSAMQAWDMDLSGLQSDEKHPTGTVRIAIEHGEPCYDIVPEQAYDFINSADLPGARTDGLLYHGSLALRHSVSRQALDALKARHDGEIFMDVNLREPWWHKDDVLAWLVGTDWVKLNHHELKALSPGSGNNHTDMTTFRAEYGLKGLIVTCGEQGAFVVDEQDNVMSIKPEKTLTVVDTVGAGDAFASVLLLGISHGWDISQTMARAQQFASALVGQRGATVQDGDFYRPFIDSWKLSV